jgi:hypothetical protein
VAEELARQHGRTDPGVVFLVVCLEDQRLGAEHGLNLADARAAGGHVAERTAETAVLLGGAGYEVCLADKLGDLACGGEVVELLGRGGLDDGPVEHDGYAVGEAEGLGLVVGDEDRGGPGGGEDLAHLRPHLRPQRGVEVAERLVQEDDGGLGGQSPGEGDALLLPAGELVGHAVPEPFEAREAQDLRDPPFLPAR